MQFRQMPKPITGIFGPAEYGVLIIDFESFHYQPPVKVNLTLIAKGI
jgi:hypothetical protein